MKAFALLFLLLMPNTEKSETLRFVSAAYNLTNVNILLDFRVSSDLYVR